ncbi:hypothetical protein EU522_00850 [Candidatus Thorarchaeota archaeon]|nr:MAG: hypothetical protein EU522_00850 [Candidatus Thorarchaeota archaeon]
MSQKSGCYIGGILLLSLVAPMVVVVLLLDWLGVGEYVFPIMIPIFIGIGAFFLVLTGIIALAIRMSTSRRSELESSIARTYEAQLFADEEFTEPRSTGAAFVIPTYCSYCQAAIDLQRVTWSGPMALICPNCGNHMRVRISEDDTF